MVTLGEVFPNFKAKTTIGDITFHDWLKDSYVCNPSPKNPSKNPQFSDGAYYSRTPPTSPQCAPQNWPE